MEVNLIAVLIALGIAVLAAPVAAQSASHPNTAHKSVIRANTAPVTPDSH
jgi:hypothetical protein